ncbi:undecaprenyl diphosphate synthase family protein [Methanomethylovorans sp.]|uniref:undecaprenyl diphosphate synthase family protein n=1 Tax=Methanomethylovorans sp. TaxID=2758717 RepID=UPI00351C13B3
MKYRDILSSVYEKYLFRELSGNPYAIPENLTLVISESDLLYENGMDKVRTYILWCLELHIKVISIYVDVLDTEESLRSVMMASLLDPLIFLMEQLPKEVGFEIYDATGELVNARTGSHLMVYTAIDFGGRSEITKAVRAILEDVKMKKVLPGRIDEKTIESHLMLKHEPDLVIRAGGKHLSDFMIWQSAYSELFFTDVNWSGFRKIDLLRVLRDFRKRQRRYGK